MEYPIKMDDLGVPLFSETSICELTKSPRWLEETQRSKNVPEASEGTFHLSLGMARGPGLFRSEKRVDLPKDRVHSHLPRRMPAEKDGQQREWKKNNGNFSEKASQMSGKGYTIRFMHLEFVLCVQPLTIVIHE